MSTGKRFKYEINIDHPSNGREKNDVKSTSPQLYEIEVSSSTWHKRNWVDRKLGTITDSLIFASDLKMAGILSAIGEILPIMRNHKQPVTVGVLEEKLQWQRLLVFYYSNRKGIR